MAVRTAILDCAYDPWLEISRHAAAREDAAAGACAVFVGSMRDFNQGDTVNAMTLVHYPEMCESFLRDLAESCRQKYSLTDVLLLHRVGELLPADTIVTVGAWAAHRAEAFAACRELIEELKANAPFWKREATAQGLRWVEHISAAGEPTSRKSTSATIPGGKQ